MRGTQNADDLQRLPDRFIPARAGNAAIARRRTEICNQALSNLVNFRRFEVAEKVLGENIEAERLDDRNPEQVQMLQKAMQALRDLQEGVEATRRMLLDRCKMRERALGGAFGIGLARSVKDLYQFLCRNYDPEDRIFLFGFSRGAFTVRILAGLIMRCGIVKAPNEDLLNDYVKHAYSEYKRDAAKRATATRWLIPGLWLRFRQRNRPDGRLRFPGIKVQRYPSIDFIGVWDTVDAYGMPIEDVRV